MNHIILARNNDDRTAERIAQLVDRDNLNSIKAESIPEFLDTIGLRGRWMTWGADTQDKAEEFAEWCRSAPNKFTEVHVIQDPTGDPITSARLATLVKSITLSPISALTTEDYHGAETTFAIGMEIMHVTDDGQVFAGTIKSIADDLLEITFIDGDEGWAPPVTCYLS